MLMPLEQMVAKTHLREPSFRIMLDHLRTIDNPLIVETGCIRPGDQPWSSIENSFKDDGMSTCIFDAFINEHGGEFHSVDLTKLHVEYAQAMISDRSRVHCNDSVEFLWNLSKKLTEENRYIDLLYMDSYDYIPENPGPSMAHHIKELAAIISRLRPGSILAVDDNYGTPDDPKGKGVYVKELMRSFGVPLIHDGVQCVWKI